MEIKNQALKITSGLSEIGTKAQRLNKETFVKTMGALSIHFPSLYKPESLKSLLPAMYNLLADLTPKRLEKGLNTFLRLHKEIYPNTNLVAYIREYALLGNFPTATEGWISRFGVNVDFITQRVVEAMGGAWFLKKSENTMADRAQFFKMFDEIAAKEKQKILLGE